MVGGGYFFVVQFWVVKLRGKGDEVFPSETVEFCGETCWVSGDGAEAALLAVDEALVYHDAGIHDALANLSLLI